MQQLAQERLRQQNRLPVQPPPRRPGEPPRAPLGQRPGMPPRPDAARGTASPPKPGGTGAPSALPPERRMSALDRYQQRYERHIEKKLAPAAPRPQPRGADPRDVNK